MNQNNLSDAKLHYVISEGVIEQRLKEIASDHDYELRIEKAADGIAPVALHVKQREKKADELTVNPFASAIHQAAIASNIPLVMEGDTLKASPHIREQDKRIDVMLSALSAYLVSRAEYAHTDPLPILADFANLRATRQAYNTSSPSK